MLYIIPILWISTVREPRISYSNLRLMFQALVIHLLPLLRCPLCFHRGSCCYFCHHSLSQMAVWENGRMGCDWAARTVERGRCRQAHWWRGWAVKADPPCNCCGGRAVGRGKLGSFAANNPTCQIHCCLPVPLTQGVGEKDWEPLLRPPTSPPFHQQPAVPATDATKTTLMARTV